MKLPRAVALTLCLVQFGVLLGACSSHKAAHPPPGSSTSTAPAAGTLVIFASTQLKPAFDKLEVQFAAANPGVSATATYQGSQALATAVQAGAQGDLFATDADPIDAMAAAGAVVTSTVQTFARNELEIVVPAGNPKGIQGLQDLANPGASFVLADPSLAAGKDAVTALALAGVKVTPKAFVSTVAQLITAIQSGDADAGIAFRSDVVAGGAGVTGVALPAGNPEETYRIGVLRSAANPGIASSFVQFVGSERGRAILAAAGFVPGS
jgi:molybdate transport system substrate-binding protein